MCRVVLGPRAPTENRAEEHHGPRVRGPRALGASFASRLLFLAAVCLPECPHLLFTQIDATIVRIMKSRKSLTCAPCRRALTAQPAAHAPTRAQAPAADGGRGAAAEVPLDGA
jgi:hypothetical protein